MENFALKLSNKNRGSALERPQSARLKQDFLLLSNRKQPPKQPQIVRNDSHSSPFGIRLKDEPLRRPELKKKSDKSLALVAQQSEPTTQQEELPQPPKPRSRINSYKSPAITALVPPMQDHSPLKARKSDISSRKQQFLTVDSGQQLASVMNELNRLKV